jgi:hypothetical protein
MKSKRTSQKMKTPIAWGWNGKSKVKLRIKESRAVRGKKEARVCKVSGRLSSGK